MNRILSKIKSSLRGVLTTKQSRLPPPMDIGITMTQEGFIRITKKSLLMILIGILVFTGSGLYLLIKPRPAQAAWADDDWGYRTSYSINNTGAADSNKKIKFDIDTATLITAGKLQSDCDDSRFTDQNGQVLKYYLDSSGGACNTASTDYYVLVPTINAGRTIIYHYYGNPAADAGTEAAQFSEATFSPASSTAASEEKGTGPVAYWKFDDGTGTTAQDSTTNNNDGTLTNSPTWQTEDMCISGKCLLFDGTDDFVKVNDANSLDLGTGDFTIQLWFRRTGNFGTRQDLINKKDTTSYTNGDYSVYIDTNNDIILYTANVSDSYSGIGANSVNDSNWHQITGVRTGTSILIYLDGKLRQTSTGLTVRNVSNNGKLRIGSNRNDGNENDSNVVFPFKGFVDEPKIYPYARTADQIKADYNSRANNEGSSFNSGGGVIASGAKQSSLSDGLVGYWKMDESSGNATDSSGNGNTLTDNNTVARVGGKFGNAGDFEADSTEYFSISDNATLSTGDIDFTVAAWVKLESTNAERTIVSKWDSNGQEYILRYNNTPGEFDFLVKTSTGSSIEADATSLGTPTTGVWYFVVAWHDSSANTINIQVNNGSVDSTAFPIGPSDTTATFQIGRYNTTAYMDGVLDEMRVYKKVLSAAERTTLYNFAPGPVGYWKFEEKTGTSAYDSSGNANTGTLTNDPTWTNGRYGAGVNFDGTDDNVTVSNTISANTVEFWVNPSSSTANMLALTASAYITSSSGTVSATGFTSPSIYVNGVLNGTITANQWNHVAATTGTAISASAITFGLANSVYLNGKLDDIRFYNYARTQKQITEDMNGGRPVIASGARQSSTGPVAYYKFDEGYGTTANNSGNQGSTLNGTLSGMASPATSTSGWTQSGKFGKAITFDGSNDYVSIPDNAAFTLANDFTLSVWVYPTAFPGTTSPTYRKAIISHRDGTNSWDLSFDYSYYSDYRFVLAKEGSSIFTSSSTIAAVNTWYHIVAVYDDVNDVSRMYVNGVLQRETSGNKDIADSATAVTLGKSAENSVYYFTGRMDEVKVYPYTLTADEVKLEYNRSSNLVLGALSDNSSYQPNAANQEYCIPGDSTSCAAPVGRWDFEEGTGTSAFDSSGNGYTGTLTSGPVWTTGKIGKAGNFNGSSDYVTTSSAVTTQTTNVTLEGWVKWNGQSQSAILFYNGNSASNGYGLLIGNGSCGSGTSVILMLGGIACGAINAGNITANQWVHLALTRDSTTWRIYINGVLQSSTSTTSPGTPNTSTTLGGKSGNNFFNGQIDQVRLFNYARSAAQIAWDYNRGAPVGHWKLDEGQGGSAYDSSGNSNTGTITIGGTGTQTAAGDINTSGTAWYNGKTGKRNYSLNFDGTDDYIDISPTSYANFTTGSVSIWVNHNTLGSEFAIWNLDRNASGTRSRLELERYENGSIKRYYVTLSTDGSFPWRFYINTPNVATSQWNHLVLTQNGITPTLYLNGVTLTPTAWEYQSDKTKWFKAVLTDATSDADVMTVGMTRFGGNQYVPLNGSVDDVRIYNYALTAKQVQLLYNDGAVRFGPNTGTP